MNKAGSIDNPGSMLNGFTVVAGNMIMGLLSVVLIDGSDVNQLRIVVGLLVVVVVLIVVGLLVVVLVVVIVVVVVVVVVVLDCFWASKIIFINPIS